MKTNPIIKKLGVILTLIVIVSSCLLKNEDFEELEFFDVTNSGAIRFGPNNTIILSARIIEPISLDQVTTYGFRVFLDGVEIGEFSDQGPLSDLSFEIQGITLDLCKDHDYQAFVHVGEREMNGPIELLEKSVIMNISNTSEISNDSVLLMGKGTGINTRFSFDNYGFFVSKNTPINPEDAEPIQFRFDGELNDDNQFSAVVDGLDLNTPYFASSYIKVNNEFCLSDPVSFNSKDGWLLTNINGPTFNNGIAVNIKDTIYFGMACDDFLCANPLNSFWKLDPNDELISSLPSFPGTPRFEAIAFAIEDTLYYGLGFYNQQYFSDLWAYNTTAEEDHWRRVNQEFPDGGRKNAVVFVIDDIAYIGSGQSPNGRPQNSFYSFQPSKIGDKWESIPNISDGMTEATGRFGAVAFTINDAGYVGLGQVSTPIEAKDFWKFENGNWEKVTSDIFPGSRRQNATVFTLNNKAYVGLGETNDASDYLFDFYQFDGGSWIPVAPFRGNRRSRAAGVGFQNGNKAYVFGGRFFSGLGSAVFNEIYEYIPR